MLFEPKISISQCIFNVDRFKTSDIALCNAKVLQNVVSNKYLTDVRLKV